MMFDELDLEGLQGFIDESEESMLGIENDFIELENDPNNLEIINRIFRPVHSLKGNSGFFGLMNINKFAHRMENLLDYIRNGDVLVTKEIIDLLLKGIEYLQNMLQLVHDDPTATTLSPEEEEFLVQIESHKPQKVTGSLQSIIDLEKILNDALEMGIDLHAHASLDSLLNHIEKVNIEFRNILSDTVKAETEPADSTNCLYFYNDKDFTEKVLPLTRAYNNLLSNQPTDRDTCDAILQSLEEFSELFQGDTAQASIITELHSMVTFLDDELMIAHNDFIKDTTGYLNKIISFFKKSEQQTTDQIKMVGEILVENNKISPAQLEDALTKQKKVGEVLVEEGMVSEKDVDEAVSIQAQQIIKDKAATKKPLIDAAKTIRIDQSKLDSFAINIGELFINIDSLNYLKKQLELVSSDFDVISKFTNTVTSFDNMVEQLHDSVMEIRKVPVKSLFQRFPKVIRQLAGVVEKQVTFKIKGEDTVIDKDLLEKIENPLVHILRNSIDHGLETPDERTRNGKDPNGYLELKAATDEDKIIINIKDDGRGINPKKIREIAIQKELYSETEAQALSDKELTNLIFKPGFSTAKQISDISGRGVGMDVVMSGLKECNGTIHVDSHLGQGTLVTIEIPLTKTMVAKDAMLVESGNKMYAIDSSEITTTIESKGDFIDVFNEDNCLNHEGKVVRVIDLNTFLFSSETSQPSSQNHNRHVLIISHDHNIALLVEKVISHQKIVVKNFDNSYTPFQSIKGIKGYTILGNEDIALIIDMKKIADFCDSSKQKM